MPKADSHKKKMADLAVLLPMAGFTIWGFSLLLTRIGQRHELGGHLAADLAAITRDAPWARLGTDDARERLFADAVRTFALQMG